MPQEFRVLCCFTCRMFQVHIVKRSSNKWDCKVCGAKQSVQKVYGTGSAADCRKFVQEFNMKKAINQSEEEKLVGIVNTFGNGLHEAELPKTAQASATAASKWESFVRDKDDPPDHNKDDSDRANQQGNSKQTVAISSDGNFEQDSLHRPNTSPRKSKKRTCHFQPVTNSKWAKFTE